MDVERLFNLVNYGVLPFWLMLLIAPRWLWTRRLTRSVVPGLLAVVYIIAMSKMKLNEGAGGASLDAVIKLFDKPDPWTALVLWIHFIAADLFIGAWEVADSIERRIPHLAVVPCLIATNLFAPAGLLAYLILRAIVTHLRQDQPQPSAGAVPESGASGTTPA